MKKLSKNKMAKLLATFLGASTILTPMVTLVSCEQIAKTLIVKEKKQKKPQPDPQPQPQPDPQQPLEELDAGSVFELQENGGEFKLTGSICVNDINSAKFIEGLKQAEGKNIDTSTFKINCFTISSTGRNVAANSTTTELKPIDITPDLLNKLLETGKDFSDLKLNNESNNKTVKILFNSKRNNNEEDYFDISNLVKFNFNNKFELDNSSKILLGGRKKEIKNEQGEVISYHYPMVSELITLLENEKLNKKITVGSIKLYGKVGKLLQKLVVGGEIRRKEEKEGESIKIAGYSQSLCSTEFNTGYFGKESEQSLSTDKLKEYYTRCTGRMQLEDVIIKNLDSNVYNGDFYGDVLTNVNFIESDLSKISFAGCITGSGYIKFKNSILPMDMSNAVVNNVILENVTFPKEEFINNYEFAELPYNLPAIENTLEIYGEIKDSILKNATPEQLESLVPQKNMPPKYKGSEEIYKRLKKIFRGEAQNKDFGNYQGSIQKQQSQLLALLQTQNKSRG